MTMVTLSEARAQLPRLVRRAQQGEDVGIVAGNQIVALRPVRVVSADLQPLSPEYVAREYDVSRAELARFKSRQARANAIARRAGQSVTFEGRFDPRLLG